MKKIVIILMLMVSFLIAKKEEIKSFIPPVSEEWINLEIEPCDDKCLKKLIDENMLASFLSRFEGSKDAQLNKIYATYVTKSISKEPFNMPADFDQTTIAVIIPQKVIKSYSIIVNNAILSYIIRQNANLNVKFFLIGDESSSSISSATNAIKSQNIKFIIAPMTANGVRNLAQNIQNDTLVFVPTIHKKAVGEMDSNFIFGGIDYEAQISKLLMYANSNVATFSDGSSLGNMLDGYVNNLSRGVIYGSIMQSGNLDLKREISGNSRLKNSSVFFNVPMVKAALLASQLKIYNADTYALLSTQINYDPMLLNFAQYSDIKNMYLATSITSVDQNLESINSILKQALKYDWIAYSTSVGMDYIYSLINPSANKIFNENIVNSQVVYDTLIYKTTPYGFELATQPNLEQNGVSQ
ncbi:hypothetical protein [Campylobacter sputorum]|uniref:hypothetical protein n=1 Tax=Campylobacter sputorum TaxID=206 RepID=UPI000B774F3C|nr:hypothetical protein [Campylobacter sputorum]ASM37269.1 hypothetical protein CSF_1420 [Campylobacter sputorum bv. faecalis CCUG 20703]